ncbi:MAG: 50S ribosomal protein L11 methyltransferase [bacterium]
MVTKHSKNDWYWEMAADCQTDQFELVSYIMFEQGASGIEELQRDHKTTFFRVFFPATVPDPVKQLKMTIEKSTDLADAGITLGQVEKKGIQNWQDGWRDFFKPIEIGNSFRIRPPWEPPGTGKNEIVIHPGQGFGTGYHESTHLALLLLEWVLSEHQIARVIDVGTGSGILAIASLLLSADHVTAIDVDPEALSEVMKNLVLSGMDTAACSVALCGPGELNIQAGLVVANIEDHILEKLADDLKNLTSPDGYLILSGVLVAREASLLNAFKDQFGLVKTQQMGEWAGFVLQKKPGMGLD